MFFDRPLSDEARSYALLAMEEHGAALLSPDEFGIYLAGPHRLSAETLAVLRRVGHVELRYRRGRPFRYSLTDKGAARAVEIRRRG